MKSATRVLAVVASGGVIAGGATALWQVRAPTTRAATTNSGNASQQAVQQLADESAQLHAAVESANSQLAGLRADPAPPAVAPSDLSGLLAQTESRLAAAQRQLSIDETLLAKLQSQARPTAPPSAPRHPAQYATPTATVAARVPAEATPTAPTAVSTAVSTASPTEPSPPARYSRSASPRPTRSTGDD